MSNGTIPIIFVIITLTASFASSCVLTFMSVWLTMYRGHRFYGDQNPDRLSGYRVQRLYRVFGPEGKDPSSEVALGFRSAIDGFLLTGGLHPAAEFFPAHELQTFVSPP